MLEVEFIDKYNSFYNGYNSTLGGEATLGHRWSDEAKANLSAIRKNQIYDKESMSKRMAGENNHMYGVKGKDAPSSRKVRVVDLELEFDTIKECAEYLLKNKYVNSISGGNISAACSRKFSFKKGVYKGFMFDYVEG